MHLAKDSFRYPEEVIGIELNNYVIKIIHITKTSIEKIAVQNFQIIPLLKSGNEKSPEDILELWEKLLKDYLQGAVQKHQKIYLSIPYCTSICKKLKFPILNSCELKAAIKWDLVEYLPKAVENYYYNYLLFSKQKLEAKELTEIFLWAIEKNIVDRMMKIIKAVKLDLQAITIDVFAVINLLASDKVDFILLEVNNSEFIISIIKERLPLKQKIVTIKENKDAEGGNINNWKTFFADKGAVTESCKVDSQEQVIQIAQEICLLRDLATNDMDVSAITEIMVYGELAKEIIIQGKLAEQTGLNVEVLNPWQEIEIDDKIDCAEKDRLEREFTCSFALALGKLKKEELNLIPAQKRALSLWERGIIIITLLVCLVATIYSYRELQKSYHEFLKITDWQLEIELWEKRAQSLAAIKKNYEQKAVIIEQTLAKRNNWYHLLSELGNITPENIKIISMIQNTEGQYLVTLEAEDIASLSNYLKTLEKEKLAKSIQVQSIEQGQKIMAKVKISFTGVQDGKNNTTMGKTNGKK